jgi:hypothetical protein
MRTELPEPRIDIGRRPLADHDDGRKGLPAFAFDGSNPPTLIAGVRTPDPAPRLVEPFHHCVRHSPSPRNRIAPVGAHRVGAQLEVNGVRLTRALRPHPLRRRCPVQGVGGRRRIRCGRWRSRASCSENARRRRLGARRARNGSASVIPGRTWTLWDTANIARDSTPNPRLVDAGSGTAHRNEPPVIDFDTQA